MGIGIGFGIGFAIGFEIQNPYLECECVGKTVFKERSVGRSIGLAANNHRRNILALPMNLERYLFVNANSSWCNISDVNMAANERLS